MLNGHFVFGLCCSNEDVVTHIDLLDQILCSVQRIDRRLTLNFFDAFVQNFRGSSLAEKAAFWTFYASITSMQGILSCHAHRCRWIIKCFFATSPCIVWLHLLISLNAYGQYEDLGSVNLADRDFLPPLT